MKNIWRLQEAKNKFNQIVEEAIENGPQTVTRRGEEVVVILSSKDYLRLKKSQISLSGFFRQSSLFGVELDLERDHTFPRDVEV